MSSPSSRRRIASLVVAGAAVMPTGCFAPTPRRPTPDWAPIFLSVRFYFARDLTATPSVVEDVVGLGGRVAAFHNDTLLIEPYYITIFDASREDHGRTFYRGGSYRLPDLAIIERGSGMVVSEYITPAAQKSRGLESVLAFGPRAFVVLLLLTCLKPIWRR